MSIPRYTATISEIRKHRRIEDEARARCVGAAEMVMGRGEGLPALTTTEAGLAVPPVAMTNSGPNSGIATMGAVGVSS